jgi:hydrogenase-4 component B
VTAAVAGLLVLAAGLFLGLLLADRHRTAAAVPLVLGLAGCLLLELAGALGLSGGVRSASMTWLLGDLGGRLVLDPLAGTFLLVVFGTAAAVTAVVISWSWCRPIRDARTLGAAVCLLLLACGLIVLAGNVFLLVFGWELLTAAFYWLAALQRRRPGRPGAAIITGVFGKVSGAALLTGLLLLAGSAGSFDLTRLGEAHGPVLRGTAFTLLIVAFAVKVGLFPVQVWLPRGYAAAPGPARALMAGSAVNVGFYGLWRTLAVLGSPPPLLAVSVLLLAALTAILGIAHATVQTRLTGVISYSSVENAGLILTGYGVALIGEVTGDPRLVTVGLLAATLQLVAHAVAKSLMFSSAGVIISTNGSDDLERLRGIARRTPWLGTALAVGSFTMAGLPPTAMFVSEWFILEALMQQFRLGRLLYALPMALAGALVALTAGFAGVAFVRLTAFTVLGRPSPTGPDQGTAARAAISGTASGDLGPLGRAGLLALMIACPGLAAITPAEIHLLARGLAPVVAPEQVEAAVASPWVLGPVYPNFSVLSPTWLVLELPAAVLLTLLGSLVLSRGRMLRVRDVPVWRSASGGVDGDYSYTPFGYANPTRRVLANLLRSRVELRPPAPTSDTETDQGGNVGAIEAEATGGVAYVSDVVEVTEAYLYRPLLAPARRLVRAARRLQSGRLDAYLLYMLIAFVAVLAVVTATS